ncbi:MAG: Bifunctional hemolysin/adenylate cyclase precursor, partial [Planctomycetota bacterium]
VAYTPDCLATFAGNLETLKAQVAEDIAIANQGLSASQSIPRIRIAGYWAAPDDSTGSLTDDLVLLADPDDGWNDGVQAKRDQFAADLVMLYEAPSAQGGAAFIGITGGADSGYSVNAAPDTYIAAKLIGFNMGACAEASFLPECNGYFDYSHAWTFSNSGALQGTIMAAGVPVLYPIYSNIYVEVGGSATGAEAANNARTMSLTANTVAKYRCSTTIDQDCNNNGIVDAEEIANGSAQDCNGTGFPDECDIAFGISEDADDDGVPDECPLSDIEFNLQGAVQLDTLGTSVSLSIRPLDPTVLMGTGAPGDDTLVSNGGEAFILEATAGAIDPLSIATLRPHDPKVNAFFGRSMSVLRRPARTNSSATYNYPARKLALVSAFRWPQESTQGNYPSKGACYLFEQTGTGAWQQVQSPLSTGGTTPWQVTPAAGTGPYAANAYALVGYSTAIGHAPNEIAELIAAGAPGQNEGRGAVYLWSNDSVTAGVRRPDRRTPLTPLTHPTPQPNDLFGAAIAIEDQIQTSATTPRVAIIIGAPGRDESRGYAVIRERATSTNSFAATFPPTSSYQFDLSLPVGPGAPLQPGYRFGEAVAIEGRMAVVGAPGASEGKGRFYIYERNVSLAGSWVFRGWFAADDSLVRGFGSAVSIAPTADPNVYQIIVGAAKADIMAGSALRVDAGAVFIYEKTLGATAPIYQGMRVSNTPSSGDEFGYSTSAVNGFSLIGAPFKDSGGLNAGAAKLITLP